MKQFLNIIWHFPYFGFLAALVYALLGVLLCCTIVLLPMGLGFLNFARFLLSPFTRTMVSKNDLYKCAGVSRNMGMKAFGMVIRVLYFPFGLLAAIEAIIMTLICFITIIGIPCGLVWARSITSIFNPVDKICVPKIIADEIERVKQLKSVGQPAESEILNTYIGEKGSDKLTEFFTFDTEKIKTGFANAPELWKYLPVGLLAVSLIVGWFDLGVFGSVLYWLLNIAFVGFGAYLYTTYKNDEEIKKGALMMILYIVPVIGWFMGLGGSLICIGEFFGKSQPAPVK